MRWIAATVAGAALAWGGVVVARSAQIPDGAALVEELGCAVCHAGLAADPAVIRSRAPSLARVGDQYSVEYLFDYLRDPRRVRQDIGGSRMPAFHLDEPEALALAEYLGARGSGPNRETSREVERLRTRHPAATVDLGAQLFQAFNCAGCHDAGAPLEFVATAPDLSGVSRLRPGWLAEWLARPSAVRPYGAHPGTGSRMPVFGLSPDEAGAIAAYLEATAAPPPEVFVPRTLTAFSADKAERLLRDRLPCLGCHRLEGEGGRIGPDLSGVGARLVPGAIREMIERPHDAVPGTIMPTPPLPADRIDLVTNYLAAADTPGDVGYLTPVGRPTRLVEVGVDGPTLYGRWCANCHGEQGNGDGYNAEFLPVPPTRHADSAYMSTRPDDTLFDGVHVGGFILGRSHRMPGFGSALTAAEIRRLVDYMRVLCRCRQPPWARDNG